MPPVDTEKELKLTAGPFLGVNDTPSAGAQDAQRAAQLVNMYAPAAAVGGDLISRPRFTRVAMGAAVTRTGTIVSILNSPTVGAVIGSGTLFTTELAVGDVITVNGNDYAVTSITDNTHLNLTAAGVTFSGQNYPYTYYPAGVKGGPIYGVWQHTLTTGTYHRFLIVRTTSATKTGASGAGSYRFVGAGGEQLLLVEWDPSNATHPLTDRTSGSMNGVSLDLTTRIYALTFANYFVISDGTNRPRKIDSSFALTNLTDANYAFQGPLTQYYGKIFGIDASDQITLRWSEENDPDTGYGTGTSNNSWSLRQTSSDGATCVIGTNQALFVFRQNSVAIITGAANSDFRSSGSVDAIQSYGTRSPDSVCLVGASVFFIDQYGRPGRIQIGYGYIPLWKRIQETLRGVGKTASLSRAAWARYDPITNLVKCGYRATGSSTQNEQMLVFDADSWECFGTHVLVSDTNRTAIDHAYSAGNPQSTSPMLDANLLPLHVVASGVNTDLAFYWEQNEDTPSAAAQDVVAAGNVTVQGTVVSPLLGWDAVLEKRFDRVAVGQRCVGAVTITPPLIQYRHAYQNYGSAKSMVYSGASTPGAITYDEMCYKVELRSINNQPARFLQCKFQNDVSSNPNVRFTFDRVTVTASGTDDDSKRR